MRADVCREGTPAKRELWITRIVSQAILIHYRQNCALLHSVAVDIAARLAWAA